MKAHEDFVGFVQTAKGLGTVAATSAGIAAVVGIGWTVCYLGTLPHGAIDLNSLRIDALAPMVATAAMFAAIVLGAFQGYSGYPFTRLRLGAERRRYLNNAIPWLYVPLALSTMLVLLAGAIHPLDNAWSLFAWLLFIPASGATPFFAYCDAKFGKRLRTRQIAIHTFYTLAFWTYPVLVCRSLASVIATERHEPVWFQLSYACALLALASVASMFMAQRRLVPALVMAVVTLILFLSLAPHAGFLMPFRLLGIADYDVALSLSAVEGQQLTHRFRECDATYKPQGDLSPIHVIVSLGDRYIATCGKKWLQLTKDPSWTVTGDAP